MTRRRAPVLLVAAALALATTPACTVALGAAGGGAGALITNESHGNPVPGAAIGIIVGAGIGYLIDRELVKKISISNVGAGRK